LLVLIFLGKVDLPIGEKSQFSYVAAITPNDYLIVIKNHSAFDIEVWNANYLVKVSDEKKYNFKLAFQGLTLQVLAPNFYVQSMGYEENGSFCNFSLVITPIGLIAMQEELRLLYTY